MIGKAVARYVRVTPRKAGAVMAPVRRRTVAEALARLGAMKRAAARPVAKVVASAFANARQREPGLRAEDVVVSRAVANEGPRGKRWRAAAFGRAVRVVKRTSHLLVELERR
jgi:large subunit ribosomal protein L22